MLKSYCDFPDIQNNLRKLYSKNLNSSKVILRNKDTLSWPEYCKHSDFLYYGT